MSLSLERRRVLQMLGVSAALPFASTLSARAATPIVVVSGRLGWPHSMPFIATKLKLWQKYGLDVDHRDLGNGSAAAEALAAGSSSYGYVNVPNAVSLVDAGLPIKILAATTIGGTRVYTFNKSIKTVADLRGKKVAIPRGVSTHALEFEMYVAPHAGLDIKRDLTLVQLAPPDNITAMLRGDVDAAVSFDPYVSEALMRGARVLVPSSKMWDGPAYTALVVARADFVAKEPETVRKLVHVHSDTIAFINAYPKKTAEIVTTLLRGTKKDLALEIASMKNLTFTSHINPLALEKFTNAMHKFGLIKTAPDLTKIVDTSFLPPGAE